MFIRKLKVCIKSASVYPMLITKCAPSAPTADFADSVRTRVIMSLASTGGLWASTADVKELAACAWPPVLVAFPQRKEIFLAASQLRRNGAVVPRGDERQPSQDGGDWPNIDDRLLRLIQQLRPALASHPPPGGDSPVH